MRRPLAPVAILATLGAIAPLAPSLAIGLALPAVWAARRVDRSVRGSPRRFLLAAGLGLAIGAGGSVLRAPTPPSDPLPPPVEVVALGTVASEVGAQPSRRRIRFRLDLDGPGPGEVRSVEVHVYADRDGSATRLGLRPGDRVRIPGRLRRPSSPGNPGESDGRTWLRRRGVEGFLSASAGEVEVVGRPVGPGPRIALARVRQAAGRHLEGAVEGEAGPLLRALCLGDRSRLGRERVRAFRRAGVSHLLALSGLHLAVICGWILHLLRAGTGGRPAVVGATVGAAVLYTLLCGARPALVRATVMGGLYLGAGAVGRRPDAGNVVAGAAIVCLLIDPLQVGAPGCQLTFAAILGIVLLRRPVERLLPVPRATGGRGRVRRLLEHGRGALSVSIAAWVATAPLVVGLSGGIAPIGPVATLLLLPGIAALLVLGPVAGLLHVISPGASRVVGVVCELLTGAVYGGTEVLGGLPGAWVRAVPPTTVWTIACYGVLLAVAAVHRSPRRLQAVLVAGALALLVVPARPAPEPPPREGVRLTCLDVGAGLSVVVRTPSGAAFLYDCGSRGRPGIGGRIVAPALAHAGITGLDAVFLSHPDADHVNGLGGLLDRVPVEVVHVPAGFGWTDRGRRCLEDLEERGVPVVPLAAGDAIRGAGTPVEVLWPPRGKVASLRSARANDRSLVLRVGGPSGVLLPGDVEERGTAHLLARPRLLEAAVLLAPHHGRSNPLAGPLGRAVAPSLVVVPSSRGDAHASTLRGYAAGSARVLETWRAGAVLVRTRPGEAAIVRRVFRGSPRRTDRIPFGWTALKSRTGTGR